MKRQSMLQRIFRHRPYREDLLVSVSAVLLYFPVSALAMVNAAGDSIEYVLNISVDGLLPSAVTELGPESVPNFYRLRIEGAFTDNARTDFDFTTTFPNHMSEVTSRPVAGENGHGVDFNDDLGKSVHWWKGAYVGGVFDAAHDNGLNTGLYASKTKFNFFDRSWDASNGAPDTVGVDYGRDKIDFSRITEGTSRIMDKFIEKMTSLRHNYSFIHLSDPDDAGHNRGWGSMGYMSAIIIVDGLLGRIFMLLDSDSTFMGKTAIVLTSDHGGFRTNHQDAADSRNYTIPFYVWGPGVPAGMDLYELNPATRQDPGTDRPDFTATPQPIRNGDAGNLALDILGLGSVAGSSIDSQQDMEFTLPGAESALPALSFISPADGETFAGTSITLEATASSNSGSIERVEFFANYKKVGEVASNPYKVEWTDVAPGNYVVTARAVDDMGAGNTARIGIDVRTTTTVESQEIVDFTLLGNYPNPFRQATHIVFMLARGGPVTMIAYDVLGREVGTIVDGWFDSGRHAVRFDNNDLATGIYFYKLQVGQVTKIGKFQILR